MDVISVVPKSQRCQVANCPEKMYRRKNGFRRCWLHVHFRQYTDYELRKRFAEWKLSKNARNSGEPRAPKDKVPMNLRDAAIRLKAHISEMRKNGEFTEAGQ